ncbi:MAG: hypothetical protein ACKPKO_51990, partial [Candidatus Fonsibacter sp.]
MQYAPYAGIYGAEVTQLADTALRDLCSAIFGVLRTSCGLGANVGLVFSECALRGRELDPELKIAHNRIVTLARTWMADLSLRPRLQRIWECFHVAGHPATSALRLHELEPLPPPGWA